MIFEFIYFIIAYRINNPNMEIGLAREEKSGKMIRFDYLPYQQIPVIIDKKFSSDMIAEMNRKGAVF